MKKLLNQKGVSLIEVLASIVIISIIFSVVSSYILSSAQYTKSMSNKYSAVQLAESLLNVYMEMEYSSLESLVDKTEAIDVQDAIGTGTILETEYTGTISVTKHHDIKLRDRVLLLTVKVYTVENGVKHETKIEGYKRR